MACRSDRDRDPVICFVPSRGGQFARRWPRRMRDIKRIKAVALIGQGRRPSDAESRADCSNNADKLGNDEFTEYSPAPGFLETPQTAYLSRWGC